MLALRLMLVRNIRVGGMRSQIRCCSEKKGDNENKNESSSDSSDEDIAPKKFSNVPKNKEDINLKLNQLLQSMLKEEPLKNEPLLLAKPRQMMKKKRDVPVSRKAAATLGLDLVKAAVEVASSYTDSQEQTKVDLLQQISKAASGLTPDGEKENIGNVTTEQLKPSKSSVNLGDLIGGMKIDHTSPVREDYSRAQKVRELLTQHPRRDQDSVSSSMISRRQPLPRKQTEAISRVGINQGVPFNIFAPAESTQASQDNLMDWAKFQESELELCVSHPPSNYFEELILWTNHGKLWHFPIDNEQGLTEENDVPFSDHIFLDHLIEGWCPKQGPIRHFMELVCVGLSKCPYLTVQAKKDHIEWYKEYFTTKEQLLKEIGAIPA